MSLGSFISKTLQQLENKSMLIRYSFNWADLLRANMLRDDAVFRKVIPFNLSKDCNLLLPSHKQYKSNQIYYNKHPNNINFHIEIESLCQINNNIIDECSNKSNIIIIKDSYDNEINTNLLIYNILDQNGIVGIQQKLSYKESRKIMNRIRKERVPHRVEIESLI